MLIAWLSSGFDFDFLSRTALPWFSVESGVLQKSKNLSRDCLSNMYPYI